MTLKQLEELEALAAKATRGPWHGDYCGDVVTEAEKEFCPGMDQHIFRTIGTTAKGPGENNAAFIAASREAVPALCQMVREAVNLLKRVMDPDDYSSGLKISAFLEKWKGETEPIRIPIASCDHPSPENGNRCDKCEVVYWKAAYLDARKYGYQEGLEEKGKTISLKDLEFKARDLEEPGESEFVRATLMNMRQVVADRANALLRERLAKAIEVSGYIHADGYVLMDRPGDKSMHNTTCPSKLHTALLVCVEEIEK